MEINTNQTGIGEQITGSEAILKSLVAEGVDTIFGYPGGQIMKFYDKLFDYKDSLRHILVRHEQGAIHAAQGYARVKGKAGVVVVTSGPGATNLISGITDAMTDSTPLVVITGQVAVSALGTDAFQEADIIGLTSPITKWNYQIRRAEDVVWAVSRAFHIANTGRKGPVVLDFTKDAQDGLIEFKYEKCNFIRSYIPEQPLDNAKIRRAAQMINEAERPFVVFGQGILLSGAQKQLAAFLEKGNIPAGSTLLGLGALPSDFPLFAGMIGMHGNIGPNVMTNRCDLLISVGMRFDNRVTGTVSTYAKDAKVIHIDIDASEIGKIIRPDVGIVADAAKALEALTGLIEYKDRSAWKAGFDACSKVEQERVVEKEIHPCSGNIKMGEVVNKVADMAGARAIVVTDVGQNQMMAARYSRFDGTANFITSGGLGTMGFGLPAAIGAKVAAPEKRVCMFCGDGGFQMTMEELGVIMQENIGVKVVILNNNWLGNVRQWQEMFYGGRYSATKMINPDYMMIAKAYGIDAEVVRTREELDAAVTRMLADDRPYILDVRVEEEGNVMPMIPPGKGIDHILLSENEWFEMN